MKLLPVTLPLLLVVSGCQTQAETDAPPVTSAPTGVEGAWRISSYQAVSPTGEVSELPVQESLMLFYDGFYSHAFSRHESPSSGWADQFNPTDDERMARLTELTVNAGRYELGSGTLTIRPIFALSPWFIGGAAEFEYELSGDQLILTQTGIVSVDGAQPPVFAAGERRVFHLDRVN